MKTALLTLVTVLAVTTAHASPFAETENTAGGKITLLTTACEGKPYNRAYYYTRDNDTEDGCWRYDGDTIIIEWDKSGRKRYPIAVFKLLNQFSKFKN